MAGYQHPAGLHGCRNNCVMGVCIIDDEIQACASCIDPGRAVPGNDDAQAIVDRAAAAFVKKALVALEDLRGYLWDEDGNPEEDTVYVLPEVRARLAFLVRGRQAEPPEAPLTCETCGSVDDVKREVCTGPALCVACRAGEQVLREHHAAQWSGPCEFCGDAHTCGKCRDEHDNESEEPDGLHFHRGQACHDPACAHEGEG